MTCQVVWSMIHCSLLLPVAETASTHLSLQHVDLQRHQRQRTTNGVMESFQSPCKVREPASVVGSPSCVTSEDSALIVSARKVRASQQNILLLPTVSPTIRVQDLFKSTEKLRNTADIMYTVNSSIGSGNVSAMLIVDTGSSDIWVKPDVYRWRTSSTANASHQFINLTYGQGFVRGEIVFDRFCVDSICNKRQGFLSAILVQDVPNDAPFDGLLGLAYPALSQTRDSFIQTLLEVDRSASPGFALALGQENDRSFIAFGDVSDLVEKAKIEGFGMGNTIDLVSPAYWMVKGAVSSPRNVDGTSILPTPIFCALDSGTSLLAVPLNVLQTLLVQIFGANPFLEGRCNAEFCLCDVDTNPLFFDFVTLEGTLRIEFTKADLLRYVGRNSEGESVCMQSIRSLPEKLPMWILGEVFLRKAYVVHDVRNFQLKLFMKQREPLTGKPGFWLHLRRPALCIVFAIVCISSHRLAYIYGRKAERTSQQNIPYMPLDA